MRYAERRVQVARFVTKFWEENGYAPSVREIGDGIGIPNPGSVQPIIARMVEEGILSSAGGRSRTIRVRDMPLLPDGGPL